jgi:DNA-binding transcriptional ArsR family regulator
MSMAVVSKHLKVLEGAGLISAIELNQQTVRTIRTQHVMRAETATSYPTKKTRRRSPR